MMFQNPSRIPYPIGDFNNSLELAWTVSVPNALMNQAVSDGKSIIFPALSSLMSFDLRSGNLNWETAYQEPRGDQINAFRTTPAILGDRVIATDFAATLYALDLSSGDILWMKPEMKTRSEPIPVWEDRFFASAINIEGEGTFGYRCFTKDGEVIWSYTSAGPRRTASCAIMDGILIFGDNLGNIYALDALTGVEVWKRNISKKIHLVKRKIGKPPAYAAGVPFISNNIAVLFAGRAQNILGMDLKSGKTRWHYIVDKDEMKGVNAVACDSNHVYFACASEELRKLSLSDGSLDSVLPIPRKRLNWIISSYGLAAGDYYIIGFNESEKLIAMNHLDGRIVWEFQGEGPFEAAPIWIDSKLVVGNSLGNIYCFESRNADTLEDSYKTPPINLQAKREPAESDFRWVDVEEDDYIQPNEPFYGKDPDNSVYVHDLAEKLTSLGIEISDDPERLKIAASHRTHALVLAPLLPDRVLVFDREMISSGRDYGRLLNSFALISGGEWEPKNLHAAIDWKDNRAFLEFEFREELYSWEFEHISDWVAGKFDELVLAFSVEHLPGRYLHMNTDSQVTAFVYLPKRAADEFERFLYQ